MKAVIGLISGIIFGLGLAVSGMSDRSKVLNFLDLAGAWDPSLMFVMIAALVVSVPGFFFILKRKSPVLDDTFWLPAKTSVDNPLVVGALIFGVGWGLHGYCPGPAVASLAYIDTSSMVFVFSMLVGIFLANIKKV